MTKQPNLQMKTQPKQLLGTLPVAFKLFEVAYLDTAVTYAHNFYGYGAMGLFKKILSYNILLANWTPLYR